MNFATTAHTKCLRRRFANWLQQMKIPCARRQPERSKAKEHDDFANLFVVEEISIVTARLLSSAGFRVGDILEVNGVPFATVEGIIVDHRCLEKATIIVQYASYYPPNVIFTDLCVQACHERFHRQFIERAISIACERWAEEGGELPSDFLCPITLDIMREPVVASDNHTYERAAIQNWLRKHRRSPMTNCPISSNELSPNSELQQQIMEWVMQTIEDNDM